jgi:hypothetical protein
MTLLSYSIKSNSQAQIRTIARDRAQEGIDFVRSQKEVLGYGGLKQVLDDEANSNSITFCLDEGDTDDTSVSVNDHIFSSLSELGSCSSMTTPTGTEITRTIAFDLSASDEIVLESKVEWLNNSGDTVDVTANTVFRSW